MTKSAKPTKYTYHGPLTGVTLKEGEDAEREVMLHDGHQVELPSDHEFVQALVAQGRLVEVEDVSAKKSAAK